MRAEVKELGKINYVIDTDSPHFKLGEVWGAFNEGKLKDYIRKYGHEELCSQLGYMQFQVWKALREINEELGNLNCCKVEEPKNVKE